MPKNPFNLAIGTKIWRSQYSSPRTTWDQVTVTSATTMSWVLSDGLKLPKNHEHPVFQKNGFNDRTKYYMTEEAALNDRVKDLHYRIEEAVKRAPPEKLRELAAMFNIPVELPKAS